MNYSLIIALCVAALAVAVVLSGFSALAWFKSRGAAQRAVELLRLADEKHKASLEIYAQASLRARVAHELLSMGPVHGALLAGVAADPETAQQIAELLGQMQKSQIGPEVERMGQLDAQYLSELQAMLKSLGLKDA
ncbi:hypothetical protein [Desulfarculus baarsii]